MRYRGCKQEKIWQTKADLKMHLKKVHQWDQAKIKEGSPEKMSKPLPVADAQASLKKALAEAEEAEAEADESGS